MPRGRVDGVCEAWLARRLSPLGALARAAPARHGAVCGRSNGLGQSCGWFVASESLVASRCVREMPGVTTGHGDSPTLQGASTAGKRPGDDCLRPSEFLKNPSLACVGASAKVDRRVAVYNTMITPPPTLHEASPTRVRFGAVAGPVPLAFRFFFAFTVSIPAMASTRTTSGLVHLSCLRNGTFEWTKP